MNGQPSANAAGTVAVGGDLVVNRLGFGAMRITGPGIWREPPDPERARTALRQAIALVAPYASATAGRSPAGSACESAPPKVPRCRTWGSATVEVASPSKPQCRCTRSEVITS